MSLLRTFAAVAAFAWLAWAPAASAQVVINEVVTHPQQHWDDGTFNPTPSAGTVTDNDEWIELYNTGTTTVSLSGWILFMNDGTNNSQTLDTFTDQYFSAGSSLVALAPGGYAVFGNPAGDMADSITLQLQDTGGRIVDQVVIGVTGAPGHGRTGAGTSVAGEAIFRSPNGVDTGNDAADFAAGPATFGAANPGNATASGAVVINEIVTQPQRDWSDSAGGNGQPFDATPGNGTKDQGDQWVELLNRSGSTLNLTGWTLEMNDSAPAAETIGLDSAVLRFSSGCSLASFGPACRAVIGDPAGAMDNAVALRLFDLTDQVVDEVEIGDDPEGDGNGDGAPSGASTGVADEAVARIPDGRDTDPNGTLRGPPACSAASCPDAVDFDKVAATILATNVAPPPPDGGIPDGGRPDGGGIDAGGGGSDGGGGGFDAGSDGGSVADGGQDAGGGRDGGGGGGGDGGTEPTGGCSCSAGGGGVALLGIALMAALARRRSGRRPRSS